MITDLKQQVDVDADVAEYTSEDSAKEDDGETEEASEEPDGGNETESSDSAEPEGEAAE